MNRRVNVLQHTMKGCSAQGVLRARTSGGKRNSHKLTKPAKQVIAMSDNDEVVVPMLKGRYPQDQFRHGEYLHVSDLLYRCIRKIALSDRMNETIHAQTIWPGQALTYKFGHTVQDYLTDVLKDNSPGQLFGNWECPCKHMKHERKTWREIKDTRCKVCANPAINYKEMVVKNREIMVTGAVDITLLIEAFLYVTECKSMSKKQWDVLKRPKPEHLLQSLFYWWLYKQDGWPLWDRASVIYVNKEYMFSGLPYKEFFFTPSSIVDRLDDLLTEARQLVGYRKSGVLPPRNMCQGPDSPDAKKCQFREVCFQMEG